MPTIFIFFGFRFMFYSNDHEPIHVHVIKDGNETKYNVSPLTQIYNHGFKKHDIALIESAHIWAETQNGWKANYPFSRWNRLANATPAQRKAFVLSRYGIHWPELNEDLCFEGLFADAGIYKPSNAEDTIYYQA